MTQCCGPWIACFLLEGVLADARQHCGHSEMRDRVACEGLLKRRNIVPTADERLSIADGLCRFI